MEVEVEGGGGWRKARKIAESFSYDRRQREESRGILVFEGVICVELDFKKMYMSLCGADEMPTIDANVIVEDEKNGDTELKVGMEFKSIDKAFESYKKYAFHCWFGIVKMERKYTIEGGLKTVIFACSKEGKQRKKATESGLVKSMHHHKPVCKINCNARMQIKTYGDGDDNIVRYEVIEMVKRLNKHLKFEVVFY
ncbi:hypothetical protein QJS10_CPB14g00915 [Acorus calamus]|uniref:FAR1 domain-containing protein n=1 Tax=Acorus calamus TaxID=4465 RepID=A0AAV9DAM1_ACOCL|nr:hypothetical protein QJS10_CPB14g00915 [Acorus calamus]